MENSWRRIQRIWLILRMHVVVVLVASVAMVVKKGEPTKVPLRLWLVGYGVLRVIESVWVCVEYRRSDNRLSLDLITSFTKPEGSTKSVLVLLWWITGSYWMYSGGKILANDAPNLYWLTAIILAFDLFMCVILPIAIACTLAAAAAYCLTLGSTILKLWTDQFSSREECIRKMIHKISILLNDTPTSRALSTENNAVCGICREDYEDGRVGFELPCGHLVHPRCVRKWLMETCTNY